MKNNFKFLLVLFVVLLVASYYVLNNKKTTPEQTQYFIPALQNQINDVDKIAISKNDKTINLYKDQGIWRIKESNNFIADANKIASLILELRKFTLKEKKTKNPSNYKSLNLTETGSNAGTKIQLEINNNKIADIFIGKKSQKSGGTYVRNNSEAQTWLATGQIVVNLNADDWIVENILDVEVSKISKVSFKSKDDTGFTISKLTPKDSVFNLDNLAGNKQIIASVNLNDMAKGLHKFSIDKVIDSKTIAEKAADNVVKYTLFSGLSYQLSLYSGEDEYKMLLKLDNADTANAVEKQLHNWAYVIPKFKYDALNKKLTDIIQDKEIEEVKEKTQQEKTTKAKTIKNEKKN